MSNIFGFDDAGIAAMSKQEQYLNEAQAFRALKSVPDAAATKYRNVVLITLSGGDHPYSRSGLLRSL